VLPENKVFTGNGLTVFGLDTYSINNLNDQAVAFRREWDKSVQTGLSLGKYIIC
jgi:hypothetical protein